MKSAYSVKQLQLLDTAELLFSRKGYEGTSVRDIAEEAGINTAMISYYFGSKEKLMEAIFERRSLNIKDKVDSLLQDDSLDPFQKVFSLLDDYIEKILNAYIGNKSDLFEIESTEKCRRQRFVESACLADRQDQLHKHGRHVIVAHFCFRPK